MGFAQFAALVFTTVVLFSCCCEVLITNADSELVALQVERAERDKLEREKKAKAKARSKEKARGEKEKERAEREAKEKADKEAAALEEARKKVDEVELR